jgi:ATP-binding cassette subfamily C protein
MINRLEQSRERTNAPQIDAADANAGISGLIRFLRLFFQSAALGLGAWLVIHKLASPGAIFAGSMLMSRALSPVDQAVAQWRTVQLAMTAYRNLKLLIAPTEVQKPISLELAKSPRLDVEGLSVLAPARDRFILRGVTFSGSGANGGVIGVIGPSGAGKTTLLECLANARTPDQGEVRLDGARLTDWDSDRLGSRTGFLPQDILLFPGTVKHNIARFRLARADNIEEQDRAVIAAAKKAGAHQMILDLPKGYDTEIEGQANRLSAGQAQQIGLARAFFGDPSFLVLDEPNAHLDSDAERSLLAALGALSDAGVLIVVTGHRMPLHQVADALLMMRDGRLEAFGPTQKVLQALRQAGSGGPRPTEVAAG